jgi:putative glycosyltransferase (TIGR04372 family)
MSTQKKIDSSHLKNLVKACLYVPAFIIFLLLTILRPLILIRIGKLLSSRLGHFAANTELYLCEKLSGRSTHRRFCFDFFYYQDQICNQQLNTMWKRKLVILPRGLSLILVRVERLLNFFTRIFPSYKVHIVEPYNSDRDIYGLLDEVPMNLEFTNEELKKGREELIKFGIPENSKIVLLCVRDNAYLDSIDEKKNWSYHNYRNADISNFKIASEELANMGFYIFRMGAKVQKKFESDNPRVIDYANNGMRSDFMDIYLASICSFVISTGLGGDAPAAACFRKPVVYVNYCAIMNIFSFQSNSIAITKHHFSSNKKKELTFKEIISSNVLSCANSNCYEENGVTLIENTPEEIRDVAIEMAKRLLGRWNSKKIDKELQARFWEIFPNKQLINGKIHHGKINLTFGSKFLRDNAWWLE